MQQRIDHGDESVNHMPNTFGIEHSTLSRKMVAMTAMQPDIACTEHYDHTKYVPDFHEVFDIGFTVYPVNHTLKMTRGPIIMTCQKIMAPAESYLAQ